MPYRVFWSPDAERLFKNLYTGSAEPEALTEAADTVDAQLHRNPHEFGESRQESVRIGFQGPLGILCEVLEDVKTVIVFNVWINKRRFP
jgi:hypothetical protein